MSDENPKLKLVTSPEWINVREKLKGTWKQKPGWACLQLVKYLGPFSSASNDKIKIVYNYVRGTGFRTGMIKHPCIEKLKIQLSSEIEKRKSKKEWDPS